MEVSAGSRTEQPVGQHIDVKVQVALAGHSGARELAFPSAADAVAVRRTDSHAQLTTAVVADDMTRWATTLGEARAQTATTIIFP